MKTGSFGIDYIKKLEGFLSNWKIDVGRYAIGYGHNEQPGDRSWIHPPIDRNFADFILKKDLVKFEDMVNNAIKIPLTQKQFDILILWVYNTGRSKSTLYDLINQKASTKTITDWWKTHYITVTGENDPIRKAKLEEVLRKRRAEEAQLWEEESNKGGAAPGILKNLFFLAAAAAGAFFLYKKKS